MNSSNSKNEIRFNLNTSNGVVEEENVFIYEDSDIYFCKFMFPDVDVTYRLELLAQLFRWNPETRLNTEKECEKRIIDWLSIPKLDESLVKRMCKKYISLDKMKQLYEFGDN